MYNCVHSSSNKKNLVITKDKIVATGMIAERQNSAFETVAVMSDL